MVIDPNNIANTGSAGAKNKATSTEPAAGVNKLSADKPVSSGSSESVSFSQEAQSLGKVEAAIAAAPEVDTSKVESVRSAIQSGQYRVDVEAIAEKILGQEL